MKQYKFAYSIKIKKHTFMKSTNKIKSFIIMMITCSAILISCKKTDPNPSSANLATGKSIITATVGGSGFSSSDLVSSAARSSGILNINGATASLPIQQFLFVLPAEVPVGTYNFATSDDAVDGIMSVSYSKTDGSSSSGFAASNDRDNEFTLVVTKSTATEMEATFSGTLYNETTSTTTSVTNGKLAAKF